MRGLNTKLAFVKDFISTNKLSLCALLETHVKKENCTFVSSYISTRFSWLFNYEFHANGRIWFGWDPLVWKVSHVKSSAQHISCFVSRLDGTCKCLISMIYAYNDTIDRRVLWSDLFTIQNDVLIGENCLPWVLLGDFNSFIDASETSGVVPRRTEAMVEFKQCIQQLGVVDLQFRGQFFTWWDNNVSNPLYRKLDRVLVNDKWLEVFDLSTASFLPRGLSDHSPAAVHLGVNQDRVYKPFQIFNHLIEHDQFLNVVAAAWEIEVTGNPWFILTTKLKNVKSALKSLNRVVGNLHQEVIKARDDLLNFQRSLSSSPSLLQREQELILSSKLNDVLKVEETLLKQKSRITWLQKGDGNNSYFFNSCKGRWNSNKLLSLDDDLGVTHTSHKAIAKTAVEYFTKLVGTSSEVEDFPDHLNFTTITDNQSQELLAPFSRLDILNCFKSMAKNRSPGPDGFTAEFFLKSWSIVGNLVTDAILYFFDTAALPRIINSIAVALIPKNANSCHLSQFRPISCCNVIYKCITKLIAKRMKVLMPFLISKNQAAFVPGRLIGDNVLLAQSLCKDYHLNSGPPRFACKLDICKAFDTLNWSFLFNALIAMGFPTKFIGWIKVCVSSCMISIKINGALEGYFQGRSGLRQGDPLSPYLFVIAMEVLSKCINGASSSDLFIHHWRAKSLDLTHLIFADDVLLFCKGEINSIQQIMSGVTSFSSFSGLKPNVSKSTCFFCNVPYDVQDFALRLTGFSSGILPVTYLGLPLISGKLRLRDCEPLINKFCRKIEHWTCKFISQAGRAQLIAVVLFGMQNHWSLFLFLPKCVLKKMQSIFSHFLWSGSYHGPCQFKVAWSDCCISKEEGGLGFKDLVIWNKGAIMYQLWRIIKKVDSIWVQWVHATILCNKAFWTTKIPGKCAWGLRKIFNIRSEARNYITYNLGINSSFLLWHDPWVRGKCLLQYFSLPIISIMESTNLALVSSVLVEGEWQFCPTNHVLAIDLRQLCATVTMRNNDQILWDDHHEQASLSLIWNTLKPRAAAPSWVHMVWHKWAVPRFSFNLWLVLRQRLLTKDRMARFGIGLNPYCTFCQNLETHEHLFAECSYVKSIWQECPVSMNLSWPNLVSGTIVGSNLDSARRHFSYLFVAVTCYMVWTERNNRIHSNGLNRQAKHLLGDIKLKIREKLHTTPAFHQAVKKDRTLQLLLF